MVRATPGSLGRVFCEVCSTGTHGHRDRRMNSVWRSLKLSPSSLENVDRGGAPVADVLGPYPVAPVTLFVAP
jgi:hypothetical protein